MAGRRKISRYRKKRTDCMYPITINRPYQVKGVPIGRGPRAGSLKWTRTDREPRFRNYPDPTLIGELLLLGVTSGV